MKTRRCVRCGTITDMPFHTCAPRKMKTIIRSKGGTRQRVVEVSTIKIPDLWKIVHNHEIEMSNQQRAAILEVWHLAHDLLRAVKETP